MSDYIHVFFFLLKSVSPEDSEKKQANYQAYRSFLNREGPKALGSREIPQVRLIDLLQKDGLCCVLLIPAGSALPGGADFPVISRR